VIVNVLGILVGLLGLGYAVYEHSQRTKMESVVRDTPRRLAGDMWVIFSNANRVNQHLRNVGHMYIEAEPNLTKIKREIFDAARDAASCARQLSLAHSKIQGIQQSLFNDSIDTLPAISSDDVRAAELMLQANEKKTESRSEPVQLPKGQAPF
jgi:hypothetical protein